MALSNRVCFQVNLRDGLRCRVCRCEPQAPETYHRGFGYHHVVPQSEGGADETENVVLLCRDCHTRYHQGRLILPVFDDLAPLGTFPCYRCGALLQGATVEMNCGWYRCDACRQKTRLFEHCGFTEGKSVANG